MKQAVALLCVLLLLGGSISAGAATTYDAYTYSSYGGEVRSSRSPLPYTVDAVWDAASTGIEFVQPEDICNDKEGNLYVADSQANTVFILTPEGKLKRRLAVFRYNGESQQLSGPTGVFVDTTGRVLVADTQNHRVVVFQPNGALDFVIEQPVGELFGEEYTFLPKKVAVDRDGRIYVLALNDFQGVLQFNEDGSFLGYIGSNKVTYDVLDLFWKRIMTEKQRNQMQQFIPVEYTNLFPDSIGFLYTVSRAENEATPVKRLNTAGVDILQRNGDIPIEGDYSQRSQLVDICCDAYGNYFVLDANRGRVFHYNADGQLLYAFGNISRQIGCFMTPAALCLSDGLLYIVDSSLRRITVFRETEYAALIRNAHIAYDEGQYEESLHIWEQVLTCNANFEYAYAQIGKALLRQEKYAEAMQYYRLGNVRGDTYTQSNGYNKAYKEYQNQVLRRNLPWLLTGMVVALLLVVVLVRVRRKRRVRKETV